MSWKDQVMQKSIVDWFTVKFQVMLNIVVSPGLDVNNGSEI